MDTPSFTTAPPPFGTAPWSASDYFYLPEDCNLTSFSRYHRRGRVNADPDNNELGVKGTPYNVIEAISSNRRAAFEAGVSFLTGGSPDWAVDDRYSVNNGTGFSGVGVGTRAFQRLGLMVLERPCSFFSGGGAAVGEAGLSGDDLGPSDLPGYIRSTTTVICTVILALGVSGNILVPLVVCHTKELRNSTNFFLINLSIADLLVLVICMPTVLIELHSRPEVWVLGEVMCKAVPYFELSVAHGSILTILAISFERYYAICLPLRAGYTCTKMRALTIILAVWIVALLVTSPVLLIAEYTTDSYIDGTLVNVCLTSAHSFWQKVYWLAMTATLFCLPLLILVVIFAIIAKHLTKDRELPTNASERSRMRSRKQVIIMLAAVVVCFFVCMLPFRVLTTWYIFAPADSLERLGMESYYNILYFSRVMLYINSAVNPILYNLISSKFREAFLGTLCCKTKGKLLRRGTSSRTTYTSLTINNSLKGHVLASSGVVVVPSGVMVPTGAGTFKIKKEPSVLQIETQGNVQCTEKFV